MKKIHITPKSEIQVHFDDLLRPDKMQFSTIIDGKVISLQDLNCDMNDLEDIKVMAVSPEPIECRGAAYESFYPHTFTVLNDKFAQPFADSMIPEHFFELGILKK